MKLFDVAAGRVHEREASLGEGRATESRDPVALMTGGSAVTEDLPVACAESWRFELMGGDSVVVRIQLVRWSVIRPDGNVLVIGKIE